MKKNDSGDFFKDYTGQHVRVGYHVVSTSLGHYRGLTKYKVVGISAQKARLEEVGTDETTHRFFNEICRYLTKEELQQEELSREYSEHMGAG